MYNTECLYINKLELVTERESDPQSKTQTTPKTTLCTLGRRSIKGARIWYDNLGFRKIQILRVIVIKWYYRLAPTS